MKLWSKEALVLGGIYSVSDFLLSLCGLDIFSSILLLIFIACALLLCCQRTPKFVSKTIENYPHTSYYLASIGWIPYIATFLLFVVSGCYYYFKFSDELFGKIALGLGISYLLASIISLFVAYFKKRKAKLSA